MKQEYTYNAWVTRVIDGDTVDLVLDLGFHVKVDIRTRLRGINAPETSTEAGRIARQALRELLSIGRKVVTTTYKDPTDKYGRWVALIEVDGVDVCQWLLTNNHAVPANY